MPETARSLYASGVSGKPPGPNRHGLLLPHVPSSRPSNACFSIALLAKTSPLPFHMGPPNRRHAVPLQRDIPRTRSSRNVEGQRILCPLIQGTANNARLVQLQFNFLFRMTLESAPSSERGFARSGRILYQETLPGRSVSDSVSRLCYRKINEPILLWPQRRGATRCTASRSRLKQAADSGPPSPRH
jgi:hypothetical protein